MTTCRHSTRSTKERRRDNLTEEYVDETTKLKKQQNPFHEYKVPPPPKLKSEVVTQAHHVMKEHGVIVEKNATREGVSWEDLPVSPFYYDDNAAVKLLHGFYMYDASHSK
eukprot:PhF_6_TR12741/c0_g1_i1/m.20173